MDKHRGLTMSVTSRNPNSPVLLGVCWGWMMINLKRQMEVKLEEHFVWYLEVEIFML